MSTSEKLKENEKSLFRRVYLARIETGASVEAAEKQALHAVKRWDALGALNDDRPDPRDAEIERLRDVLISYESADQALTAILANHGLSDKPEALAKEISTYENMAQKLGELSAMLALYSLPSEPKALAKQIELLRQANADESQRLRACFAVVREVLHDPNLDPLTNAETLYRHLGEFLAGNMSVETLREQFYSPDSGPWAKSVSQKLNAFHNAERSALLESRAWRKVKEFLEREEPATIAKIVTFLQGAKAGEELRDEDAAQS